jgi:hypothetical protein
MKVFKVGTNSAKEFTDVLLVFGDDVILFSDKEVAFNEEKPIEVDWVGWYARQLFHPWPTACRKESAAAALDGCEQRA